MVDAKEKPSVSIVIPTYNRCEKLIRLIKSVLASDYPVHRLEIIIIDDASSDDTSEKTAREFQDRDNVKISRNRSQRLLSASRNKGICLATGDFIFVIDDDNVIDKNCIGSLVESFSSGEDIGAIMPLMYYYGSPERIWCAGVERDMLTSITRMRWQVDPDHAPRLSETKDFPNAFMVRRKTIDSVGLLDEADFPIHYDEADYGERIRRAGYRVLCDMNARIWHDFEFNSGLRNRLIHNETRTYFTARNRIVFHSKYSKPWQFAAFILFFNQLITGHYLLEILGHPEWTRDQKLSIGMTYLRGVRNGLLNHLGIEKMDKRNPDRIGSDRYHPSVKG